MIAVIVAAAVAIVAAVLLVITAACIHLEERRARIRQRPKGRITSAVRRVIGPYARDDTPPQAPAKPVNDKQEVQV